MEHDNRQPPLDRLFTLGRPDEQTWAAYEAMGFTLEHVPELIRVASGRLPMEAEAAGDDDLAADDVPAGDWAPVHAWRALGELRAAEAVGPLIALFPRAAEVDDEWAMEELPKALALIGEPALAPLAELLDDRGAPEYARSSAGLAVARIAQRHGALRDRCVSLLAGALDRGKGDSAGVNGLLVAHLLELRAREAADVILAAYAAGRVDSSIAGDADEVRRELGLPTTSPPRKRPPLTFLVDDAVERVVGDLLPRRPAPPDPLDNLLP
jgi:hypothetical protein